MDLKEKVSKRILGFLSYLVGLSMAVASGLEFYALDSSIILFVLGNGSVLLGIDAWKQVKNS
jgi:hypothetical protein